MEGLLPYLPEAEVQRLLKRIRNLSAAGSYLGADHPSDKLFSMSMAKNTLDRLNELKAPLVSLSMYVKKAGGGGGCRRGGVCMYVCEGEGWGKDCLACLLMGGKIA